MQVHSLVSDLSSLVSAHELPYYTADVLHRSDVQYQQTVTARLMISCGDYRICGSAARAKVKQMLDLAVNNSASYTGSLLSHVAMRDHCTSTTDMNAC
jgi:hypothetical protein